MCVTVVAPVNGSEVKREDRAFLHANHDDAYDVYDAYDAYDAEKGSLGNPISGGVRRSPFYTHSNIRGFWIMFGSLLTTGILCVAYKIYRQGYMRDGWDSIWEHQSMYCASAGGLTAALAYAIYMLSIGNYDALGGIVGLGITAGLSYFAYRMREDKCWLASFMGSAVFSALANLYFLSGKIRLSSDSWNAAVLMEFFQPVVASSPTLSEGEQEWNDSTMAQGGTLQDPTPYENDGPHIKKIMGKDVVLS